MTIRFRKIFSKGDYFAIGLLLLAYCAVAYVIFQNYQELKFYSALFLIECLIYHWNRTDIELLKLKKAYKILLFSEYLIYTFPLHLILMLKQEWLVLCGVLIFLYCFISLPRKSFKAMKYPFLVMDPFWIISFRKYGLIIAFPLSALFAYLAIRYQNDNLILGIAFGLTLIGCLPSFEKERQEEIKRAVYNAEDYLQKQARCQLVNALILTLPLIVVLLLYPRWELLYVLCLPPSVAIINVLLRYVFFKNSLLQQFFLLFFVTLSIATYGIPLLSLPFLYKKAVANLQEIKYAKD